MKRRNFLKFLGVAAVAPTVAVKILSSIPVKAAATVSSLRKGVPGNIFAKQLKKIYGQEITKMFKRQTMMYDKFKLNQPGPFKVRV